jgi:hypothetical protein
MRARVLERMAGRQPWCCQREPLPSFFCTLWQAARQNTSISSGGNPSGL